MGNRLFVFIYIEVLCKFFTINAEPLFHKTADKVAAHMKAVYHNINLSSVAGSDNDALQYALGRIKRSNALGMSSSENVKRSLTSTGAVR